ncbi:MAG: hypothetical protein HUU20_12260 [Pirellulales bacterium]|nr:hypothetical protein [Pirellulales bacterium]
MSTRLKDTGIPPEVSADAETIALCVAAGKPIPDEIARRVRERSQEVTERLRTQFGTLDIGVPAIRELRGELPAP